MQKERKWLFPVLAFAVPFLGYILVMIVSGYAPFGSYSILYSDMYHQYFPFFKAFRNAIRSGDGLLYTWSVGLGMDYLGLIAYYLASPLNLLGVLMPESWLLGYFSLMVPIKLGLASLFFSIMLQKYSGKRSLAAVAFGCFYGLCSWALGYQWNIMWLDTFALLPLVILGAYYMLKKRKFFLYVLTLFLAVGANYYIGFMVCVFVVLFSVCYEICNFTGFKKLFIDIGLMLGFSLLAVGMTAFLELPAYAALQTTNSGVNTFPQGFKLNIADENTWQGLLDAMRQVLGNSSAAISPTFKEGLPNIYCGLGTALLGLLFFSCRQIKLREKLCCGGLLLFFILSFIIRQLDYLWHGMHFTNMIPYRFSFLYCFVLLFMGYRAFCHLRSFHMVQVVTAGLLGIFLICFAKMEKNFLLVFQKDQKDFVFWFINGILFVLYVGILIYGKLPRKLPEDREGRKVFFVKRHQLNQFTGWVVLMIMAAELVMQLINFGVNYTGTSVRFYPRGKEYTASMVRYMDEREALTEFYRAETTHSQTLNDGALNGYNGVSAFTSSANVSVTYYMKALGYGAKNTYNRYCFEESSPVANLFLGLKYMIDREGQVEINNYFDIVHSYGTVSLLENNAYLPLGFLADKALEDVDFSDVGNRFRFQNSLLTAASGVAEDAWQLMGEESLSITSEKAELLATAGTGFCSYSAPSGGSVTFSYTADREGLFCFDIEQTKKNGISVSYNGTELYTETYSLPQMLSVCQVVPGDVIDIRLACGSGDKGSIILSAAILDEAVFRNAYNVLNASVWELETFKSTYISGTVSCNRDGVLYTSVPQNGNWQVWVDGEPADAVKIGDCMVGVELTQGVHEVILRYKNAAFVQGCLISIASLALFTGITLAVYKPFKRKKGKYQAA